MRNVSYQIHILLKFYNNHQGKSVHTAQEARSSESCLELWGEKILCPGVTI